MKTITLRDIPKPIADIIQERAARYGASLNKTVIDLLSQAIEAGQTKRRRYHDLDHLVGTWSDEEADAFNEVLREQRTIDQKLWR